MPALASLTDHLGERVGRIWQVRKMCLKLEVAEIRNDMYLSTTSFKRLEQSQGDLPKCQEEAEKSGKSLP